ncbi:hypothetical protein [Sinisalibacter lacisalsi]|uniref:Uncharacterized protein n=1 Tax=Sinisalibacter lacisalsi TaxID=1526570 RepID=A0ABQ1QGV4_9RHOB|nr:hypothetical protein [Sinisalibacter lacisalsi]GGD26311.1 hypothetical protein GCM10011358_08440 [Sinisalibacter lacisalsi]
MNRIMMMFTAIVFATGAQAGDCSTSYNTMTLPDTPGELRIFAPYDYDNGRIIGQMRLGASGPVITGTWIESGSGVTCDSAVDGSNHWGAVTLQFNPGYTSFTGNWDYCGEGGGGKWVGEIGAGKVLFRGLTDR